VHGGVIDFHAAEHHEQNPAGEPAAWVGMPYGARLLSFSIECTSWRMHWIEFTRGEVRIQAYSNSAMAQARVAGFSFAIALVIRSRSSAASINLMIGSGVARFAGVVFFRAAFRMGSILAVG
jgi:hypothetical protein